MTSIRLRNVAELDLPIFFEHQLDPQATTMAAFPSRDREAFDAHWKKIMANKANILMTIEVDGIVTGNIVSWDQGDKQEVGYWLGREFWGKGIATEALNQFLGVVKTRPLFAHVAKHNVGSKRVLEKCGFTIIGENKYVNGSEEEVDELVFQLDGKIDISIT